MPRSVVIRMLFNTAIILVYVLSVRPLNAYAKLKKLFTGSGKNIQHFSTPEENKTN